MFNVQYMSISFFIDVEVKLNKIEKMVDKKSYFLYLKMSGIEILMKISSDKALHFCSMPNNKISIFN